MSLRAHLTRVIIPLPDNEAFAEALAEVGGFERGALETRRFPDGETYVRLLTNVADKAVDLVCSLARPERPTSRPPAFEWPFGSATKSTGGSRS